MGDGVGERVEFVVAGLELGVGVVQVRVGAVEGGALQAAAGDVVEQHEAPGVLALAPLVQEALDQLEVYRPQVPEQPALVFLAELIPSFEEMSLPGFLRLGNTDLVGL